VIRRRTDFNTSVSDATVTPCPGGSSALLVDSPRNRVKLKICLVGDSGVGKSSIIRRYVLDIFNDAYLQTLGAKVTKKSLVFPALRRGAPVEIVMTIWDIMGNAGFQELLKDSYFYGCQGVLAVADVTSRTTLEGLDGWIDRAWDVAGEVPVHILVNKVDLVAGAGEEEDRIRAFSSAYDSPYAFTSAKRGDNVSRAFEDLARRIVEPRPPDLVLVDAIARY